MRRLLMGRVAGTSHISKSPLFLLVLIQYVLLIHLKISYIQAGGCMGHGRAGGLLC